MASAIFEGSVHCQIRGGLEIYYLVSAVCTFLARGEGRGGSSYRRNEEEERGRKGIFIAENWGLAYTIY